MRIYDKTGKQIGVQNEEKENYFFKKEDNKNPPKDIVVKKVENK